MRDRLSTLGYPHLLLIGLVGVLCFAAVYAGVTSAAAFGSSNPGWDGTAGLQQVADRTDTETTIFTSTTEYSGVPRNGTLAIVLSPEQPYTRSEQGRLTQFVRGGGTLLVATDFTATGNQLLGGVGSAVRVDGQTLRDEQEYYRSPALPVAPSVTSHPLTTDVDQLTLNYGSVIVPAAAGPNTSVEATNATVLVRSSEYSYLDVNGNEALDQSEKLQSRPVVTIEEVGAGQVIVVSDPSVFINAMIDRPGNQQFVANLFAAHDRVVFDQSHTAAQPPLTALLLTLRKSSLLTALLGTLVLGGIGVWVRYPGLFGALNRDESHPTSAVDAVDDQTVAAYLSDQHPTWDPRRVRRIMTGVFAREANDSEDE